MEMVEVVTTIYPMQGLPNYFQETREIDNRLRKEIERWKKVY
jgi:hypothetical protein